ncbi:YraN family protein [Clostridium sp. E02]|uniref:YraN family protein n=1 Tax=Clostridium sp. E02 TaxID=2487134 RepID=UPI000F52E92D|nr:YraN family protein [Clostridium sp. E02]
MNTREIGSTYESLAASFLKQAGYDILEQNYRDRSGEIDLIANDGKYYVFIEVKYRANGKKGDPAEAVDAKKQFKIRNMARRYLYRHHLEEDTPCRFDVVAILGQDVRLIQNAF